MCSNAEGIPKAWLLLITLPWGSLTEEEPTPLLGRVLPEPGHNETMSSALSSAYDLQARGSHPSSAMSLWTTPAVTLNPVPGGK